MKNQCLFIAGLFLAGNVSAQLAVTNSAPYNTVSYLVQNVLMGTGVQVSNITYTGAPNAIGYFNGLNSNLNLDSGIIFTSGNITDAVGPNASSAAGIDNLMPGDFQLEQITNNTANGSYDASVIEFDFLANSDTIKFEYVFGSEEYMEWVNSSFNDAFAFIISGVSVALPATNIAILPSPPAPPNTPVTIDNVNLFSFPQFYFDNGDGTGSGTAPDGLTVQYDGFTTVLPVIFPVKCGETYHIKMVVADIGDEILDSGVLLKAGSFKSSGSVTTSVIYNTLNDSTLYEGCGQACIIIDRGQGHISQPDTVTLSFSGIAQNGADITLLPDTVFFAVGQSSVTICVNGINDALTEGPETLTILAVLQGSACSLGDSALLTLYIDDLVPLSVLASSDITVCPGSTVQLSATPTGGIPPIAFSWSPVAGVSNSTIANPIVSPSITTAYIVTVIDSCLVPNSDTVVIHTLPPGPIIIYTADASACLNGTPISLSSVASGGVFPYTYQWTTITGNDSVTMPFVSRPTLIPTAPGKFLIVISDFCGNKSSDTVNVYTEDCEIIIPNVISANGDGTNDFFAIKNLNHYRDSRLVIFNRWGRKIYDDPDYRNDWDAQGYSEGTYYYVLYRSDGEMFHGFLTVLR